MNQLVSYSNRYFKSATLNTPMSQKTERILALFFIPLSLIALIIVLCSLITALNSTVLYFKLAKLKEEYQPKFEAIKQNEDLWKQIHPNEVRTKEEIPIDLNPYREAGVDNINPTDPSSPQQALDQQYDNIVEQIITVTFCLLSFILPWIIIRIFYWVKTADKTLIN